MHDASCTGAQCDLFDFMAHHVGFRVLHPGGVQATETQAQMCGISTGSSVLDIACGKGRTAIYLARKHGCHVVGVDIDPELIESARAAARRRGVGRLVEFRQADALILPFGEGEFDVALSQAYLILVSDKEKAIREAVRVTKPGGRMGWLELSFREKPPAGVLEKAATSACVFCLKNAETFEDWRNLLERNGVTSVEVVEGEMGTRARRMVRDEGVWNSARVMAKWLCDGRVRQRMRATFSFFGQNRRYVGYGVYVGEKSLVSQAANRAAEQLAAADPAGVRKG